MTGRWIRGDFGGKRPLAAEQHKKAQSMETEVGLGRFRKCLAKVVSGLRRSGDVFFKLAILTLMMRGSFLGRTWSAAKAILRGKAGRKKPLWLFSTSGCKGSQFIQHRLLQRCPREAQVLQRTGPTPRNAVALSEGHSGVPFGRNKKSVSKTLGSGF